MARHTRNPKGTPALDSVSRAIIEQLQEDGRRPYGAIGRAVGLSEAAVRQRVQKLLDQDVMRVVAVTDPQTVGLLRRATVGLTVDGAAEPVSEALAETEEIASVAVTAGSFDLLAEVACEDDEHLLEVIDRIRALPGVRTTESFVHLGPRRSPRAGARARPDPGPGRK